MKPLQCESQAVQFCRVLITAQSIAGAALLSQDEERTLAILNCAMSWYKMILFHRARRRQWWEPLGDSQQCCSSVQHTWCMWATWFVAELASVLCERPDSFFVYSTLGIFFFFFSAEENWSFYHHNFFLLSHSFSTTLSLCYDLYLLIEIDMIDMIISIYEIKSISYCSKCKLPCISILSLTYWY